MIYELIHVNKVSAQDQIHAHIVFTFRDEYGEERKKLRLTLRRKMRPQEIVAQMRDLADLLDTMEDEE